jgi:hypothetical protein
MIAGFLLGCAFVLQAQQATPSADVLPAPTGPHKTGRMTFHWKDTKRDELETSDRDDKRELMVHVFYPADPRATTARATYVPDADAMLGPWNDGQVARITAMRAFSRENAAVAPGTTRYPVIVFSPGGGMKGLTYHALLEDLASHGWVVAAIDPPYNARAVRFPDGRILGGLAPGARGWPQPRSRDDEMRFYRERVEHLSNDISFVIDQLTALDMASGPFARRLDLAAGVGALGHSRGGQAAGTVRLLDERIRGGVNIDGTQGPYAFQPVKGESVSGATPFMWIQGSLPAPPSPEQLQRANRTRAQYDSAINVVMTEWKTRLGRVSGGAFRVYIDRPGIQHIDFSDEPYWDGTMTADNRPGRLETMADTRAWVRAFFDGTVRRDWTAMKRLTADTTKSKPEVTVTVYGKPWPQ